MPGLGALEGLARLAEAALHCEQEDGTGVLNHNNSNNNSSNSNNSSSVEYNDSTAVVVRKRSRGGEGKTPQSQKKAAKSNSVEFGLVDPQKKLTSEQQRKLVIDYHTKVQTQRQRKQHCVIPMGWNHENRNLMPYLPLFPVGSEEADNMLFSNLGVLKSQPQSLLVSPQPDTAATTTTTIIQPNTLPLLDLFPVVSASMQLSVRIKVETSSSPGLSRQSSSNSTSDNFPSFFSEEEDNSNSNNNNNNNSNSEEMGAPPSSSSSALSLEAAAAATSSSTLCSNIQNNIDTPLVSSLNLGTLTNNNNNNNNNDNDNNTHTINNDALNEVEVSSSKTLAQKSPRSSVPLAAAVPTITVISSSTPKTPTSRRSQNFFREPVVPAVVVVKNIAKLPPPVAVPMVAAVQRSRSADKDSLDSGAQRPHYTCSACGGHGHNRRSCNMYPYSPSVHSNNFQHDTTHDSNTATTVSRKSSTSATRGLSAPANFKLATTAAAATAAAAATITTTTTVVAAAAADEGEMDSDDSMEESMPKIEPIVVSSSSSSSLKHIRTTSSAVVRNKAVERQRTLEVHAALLRESPAASQQQIEGCLRVLEKPIPCTNKNMIIRLTGGVRGGMHEDVRQILFAGDTKVHKQIPVEFMGTTWYLSSAVPSRRKRCSRDGFDHASKYWVREAIGNIPPALQKWVSVFQYDSQNDINDVRVKLTGVVTEKVMQFVCFLYGRAGITVEMRCSTFSTSVFKDRKLCVDPFRISNHYAPDGEISRNQSNCAVQWPLLVGKNNVVKVFFHTGGAVQVLGTLDEPEEHYVRGFLIDVLRSHPEVVRHIVNFKTK